MKSTIFYILTALLVTLALTACGTLPQESSFFPKQAKAQKPIKPSEQRVQSKSPAQLQARQLLDEQDYVGTINLIQDEMRRGADEQAFAKELLQAANGGLSQANTLINQGHYSKAALLLGTVQDSYPQSLELQQQITASPVQITDKINFCTEAIMEAGLVSYRSGDFAAAIETWSQVLEFNPQHQAAQSSIETTQLQLANLKTLDSHE